MGDVTMPTMDFCPRCGHGILDGYCVVHGQAQKPAPIDAVPVRCFSCSRLITKNYALEQLAHRIRDALASVEKGETNLLVAMGAVAAALKALDVDMEVGDG